MDKDVRKLVQQLTVIPGVSVESGGGSHLKVFKRGKFVTTLPCSPSDSRWRSNTVATLRRHGLTPGKKLDTEVRVKEGPGANEVRAAVARITEGQGALTEFARFAEDVAKTVGVRPFKSVDSARVSVRRFISGGDLSDEKMVLVTEAARMWQQMKQSQARAHTPTVPSAKPPEPDSRLLTVEIDLARLNEVLGPLGLVVTAKGDQ